MARPKKTRPTKKAARNARPRNAAGRFVSKDDEKFAKAALRSKDYKQRANATTAAQISERKQRAKKPQKVGVAKTTKTANWVKTVYRVRGKRNEALNDARDWLQANARQSDLTWANVGGRTERSRFYGSKGGKRLKTASFLENEASQYGYGKAKGVNSPRSIVTVEVVVLRKRK